MEEETIRRKYEKAFIEQGEALAGKPLPEQASEACWKVLAQMTSAEALAFRRTEETEEEKKHPPARVAAKPPLRHHASRFSNSAYL